MWFSFLHILFLLSGHWESTRKEPNVIVDICWADQYCQLKYPVESTQKLGTPDKMLNVVIWFHESISYARWQMFWSICYHKLYKTRFITLYFSVRLQSTYGDVESHISFILKADTMFPSKNAYGREHYFWLTLLKMLTGFHNPLVVHQLKPTPKLAKGIKKQPASIFPIVSNTINKKEIKYGKSFT